MEYQYWTAEYDRTSSDYDSQQGKLILRHKFNILEIEGGVGYHSRDFDQPALSDMDEPAYHLAVKGDTGKTTFSLKSEWNMNDAGAGDSYYMAHRISADVGHTFLEKLPVAIGGYWQNSDYEHTYGLTPGGVSELRDEDTFNINGSVGYLVFDWLTVSVETGYEERDSNHAGRDYDNSWVMGLVKMEYEIGAPALAPGGDHPRDRRAKGKAPGTGRRPFVRFRPRIGRREFSTAGAVRRGNAPLASAGFRY